ncbi:MAG TPA: MEDS domain-containing protein [Solirubrobacteraceae bacterium]|nr:MEDS domain-containing protein [Solirubrobacteraceae bacterium]
MAVRTQAVERRVSAHVVQFYTHDSELVASAGSHLGAALRAGGVGVAIATRPHREAFEAYLARDGVELALARAEGRLVLLDANATLHACMRDGEIDGHAFHTVIGGLLREAQESGGAVHVYGEMVTLLWDAGEVPAAIELETLWNELAEELAFSLLCAYPAASATGEDHVQALHAVCALHSAVLGHPGEQELENDDQRSTSRLVASFQADAQAPGEARRLLIRTLRDSGCASSVVDTAALVLSELTTNAVRHARSSFTIDIAMHERSMRLAVRDARPPSADDDLIVLPTHGLSVIDALATRWGVECAPDGKVVWAELRI